MIKWTNLQPMNGMLILLIHFVINVYIYFVFRTCYSFIALVIGAYTWHLEYHSDHAYTTVTTKKKCMPVSMNQLYSTTACCLFQFVVQSACFDVKDYGEFALLEHTVRWSYNNVCVSFIQV